MQSKRAEIVVSRTINIGAAIGFVVLLILLASFHLLPIGASSDPGPIPVPRAAIGALGPPAPGPRLVRAYARVPPCTHAPAAPCR